MRVFRKILFLIVSVLLLFRKASACLPAENFLHVLLILFFAPLYGKIEKRPSRRFDRLGRSLSSCEEKVKENQGRPLFRSGFLFRGFRGRLLVVGEMEFLTYVKNQAQDHTYYAG